MLGLILRCQTFVLFYLGVNPVSCIKTTRLVRPAHCPGRIISPAHRYGTLDVRSRLECVSFCWRDADCLSMVFDSSDKTCYLNNGTAKIDCCNTIPALPHQRYYEKLPKLQCKFINETKLNSPNCTCSGYFGQFCNITFADCEEYRPFDPCLGGIYSIKPIMATAPFSVYCEDRQYVDTTRIRVLSRNGTAGNFNLTWQEYRNGFSEPDYENYWMGLENLYQIAYSKKYSFRFRLTLQNETQLYETYPNFTLNNESTGYTFTYDVESKVKYLLGDCLSDLLGAKFSTYDVDNDDSSSVNCALQHGAGWWFKGDNCSSCNPLGPIISPYNGTRKGIPGELFWKRNLGDVIPCNLRAMLSVWP